MTRIRAVVFDMGNTLWFEAVAPDLDVVARAQAERVQPLLIDWGIALSDPLSELLREVLKDLWLVEREAEIAERERGTYREIDVSFLIRGALAVRGIEISSAQSEQWFRASWIPVRAFGVQLYPDVLDVLRELQESGIRIGINTNRPCTTEMFQPDLEDFGLAPYVDAAVCSGDTGYMKPHPSTFELILRKLDVPAEAAVMVGDAAEGDMSGAKAIGMHTVWKLNGRYDPPPCPDADFGIHDLAELLTLPLLPLRVPHLAAAESLTPHDDENAGRY